MPNSNFGNIQYKASNGLIKLDELEGIVECFVSGIGNKDSVGDICATGAFAKSLLRRKPRVVWGHNWNDPIGKVLEIYEVPASDPRLPMKMKMAGIGGLYAKVQFNLQSEKGKEAFANVAFFGEEQEWSIGYKTLRAQYDDNLQANVLYEVELYEVSPVLHGANQLTGTISVKSDEEKMHGMMPLVIGGPGSNAPSRENIFEEGMAQRISGSQLASVVAELSRRAGGPVMVVEATENSVVFVKPGKGKFRIGYHFTGSEYMFGKPELIHADQPKPQMQSGPSPVPGISAKPTVGQKPATTNPAMPMPVAVKPGNGGMVMVPLPQVEYEGMDKNKKPELVAEERELAESLVRIAGKYGKFDEDGDGIWAGYYPPAENKVKDIGVKCSNCVLYQGEGKCKILDLKVEDEGKCRFAIIPDGVVVGFGKKEYNDILDDEEIKMVEDIEAKYPGEFILGVLRNTVKKRRKKRRSYKTLEEWGVEEQELMEKGLDPFLAQDASYVLPVDPANAFEFKSMIDPVLEYHRIDTYVNEYGVVIASQLDQEAKDALETATKAAARRLGRSLRNAGGGGNFLGRTLRGGRGLGVPSGDLDPRTRRDSNTNGILFDKIPGWEQPDPTPNGPGSINNPKPSKRQLADAAKPDGKEKLSSGKRNMRRHADRSADMEKQFPNAEENQKRADHEAIAKAWEDQGLGWEEVPRYNADKNLSSDYLRGREIGVNQARVMWQGDSVRKRPEKFNEKQKASQEYSNWYSSYAKSVSAYLDAHSRDDSDNWDGIEEALRADVKSKYPDTQDWAKEDIATLNEYLNDIGLLDVDKLKKKKKKKAGAETAKEPDLQELRKLNAEGKLSSGKAARRDLVSGKKVPGEGKFARLIDEQMGNRNDEREPSYVARKYADALVENWRSLSDSERKEFLQDEMGSEYMPKAEEFLEILDEAWATYSQRNKKFKDIDNELQDIMDSSRLSSGGRLGASPDDAEYGRELAAQRARDRAAGRNATNPIGRGGDSGAKKKPAKEKPGLSSGRTRDPNNDGFLRETDYNDPDAGYGLVPRLMKEVGFDEYEARDAMDYWNSLDDDEMKEFEDARDGDVYGAISDAWDESQAATQGGEKLSSGRAEWTKTEDGLEMDAPDIDGMYRINNEGNGKYSVTRFSDIYRNGGQNAIDEDIDRTFNSPSAAKKWAEKDYDKIIENMVRDEEYMQDSSRLSSGRNRLSSGRGPYSSRGEYDPNLDPYFDEGPEPDYEQTHEAEWDNIPSEVRDEIIQDIRDYVANRDKVATDNVAKQMDDDEQLKISEDTFILEQDGAEYVATPVTREKDTFASLLDAEFGKLFLESRPDVPKNKKGVVLKSLEDWSNTTNNALNDGAITEQEARLINTEIEKIKSLIENPSDGMNKSFNDSRKKIENVIDVAAQRLRDSDDTDRLAKFASLRAVQRGKDQLSFLQRDYDLRRYRGEKSKDGKYEITEIEEFAKDAINGGELEYEVDGFETIVSPPAYTWYDDFAKFSSGAGNSNLSSGRQLTAREIERQEMDAADNSLRNFLNEFDGWDDEEWEFGNQLDRAVERWASSNEDMPWINTSVEEMIDELSVDESIEGQNKLVFLENLQQSLFDAQVRARTMSGDERSRDRLERGVRRSERDFDEGVFSSGRQLTAREIERQEMDAADNSLRNFLNEFDGWEDEEWEFGNQLDGAVERWASENANMPWINTSVEDMIDELSVDESIEGQNKLVFLENLQQSLFESQYRRTDEFISNFANFMSGDERSRDRLERGVRRSERDFDEGVFSSGANPQASDEIRRIVETNQDIERAALYVGLDEVYEGRTSRAMGARIMADANAGNLPESDGEQLGMAIELIDEFFPDASSRQKRALEQSVFGAIARNARESRVDRDWANRQKLSSGRGKIPPTPSEFAKKLDSPDGKLSVNQTFAPNGIDLEINGKKVGRFRSNESIDRFIREVFSALKNRDGLSSGRKRESEINVDNVKKNIAELEAGGDRAKAVLKRDFRGRRYSDGTQFGSKYLGKDGDSYSTDIDITDEELEAYIRNKYTSDAYESMREDADAMDDVFVGEDGVPSEIADELMPYLPFYDEALAEMQKDPRFKDEESINSVEDLYAFAPIEDLLFDTAQKQIRIRKRKLDQASLSSGRRKFDDLDDIDKQQAAKNLASDISRIIGNSNSDPDFDYGFRKFIDDSGDYERGDSVDAIRDNYASFLFEAAEKGDWETLEEHDVDLSTLLEYTPEAHPDVEMEYELDKSDREWADMMSEMRRDLSSDGTREDEVERILDHWLYSSDSPRQEEYLEEYREPGDSYNDTFTRAAKAMYQDHLERLYDNRQDRNLSSGKRTPEQESRISDREVFERRMAGESLAETAAALGMKREEVRQAELRHMARERGTLQRPDSDEIEAYREDQARMAAEEAADLALNESLYIRRMGGESLADVAKATGMSREEVRNREQKHMQLLRSMDAEAKRWLESKRDGKLSSGSKAYVSPLDDLGVGQKLSSGKLDEVYRSVQDKLIEQIEKIQESGDGKWEFPWHRTSLPKNVTNNNRPYTGVNSVMLMFKQDAMGYDMPLWAGFNQWKKLGGTVRKGEKGTMILIPTIIPKKKDADGNEIRGSGGIFFKTGHVFNIDQIDGIDKEQFKVAELPEEERVAELEQALSEIGAVVNTGGDRAFYRPSTDEIHLPPFSAFKSREGYYAVFAHELMHWTGHPSRLNRDHLGEFGSPEYAQEELVAEIASAFFMAAHGLTPEPREDHAQYLASWLKKLKSDPDAMKKAFGEAQKAHEYAISKSPSMSAKLGKKVAEAGIIPGNDDGGYGDIGPSLSSGRIRGRGDKYVLNPEGTTRTLADEMGAFGDEVLTDFRMRKGYRSGDRNWFEAQAFLGGKSRPSQWNVSQDEFGDWFAELMVMDGVDENDEIDWDIAGVGKGGFKSPEDAARWADSYAESRREWQRKFRAETDFDKIAEMLSEEEARRDAEYENYKKESREYENRQEYARMMAQIDESRLEWSAEDWADEAADIQAELMREDSRFSSGIRSRYDDKPVEEIGLVTDALQRTDEAGSNSRHIASRLLAVPVDKYDFDSIRRNGEVISFTYNGKPRMVYPTGMMTKKGGGIYFIGLDEESGQYRSFSLHKIEGLIDGAIAPINPTQPGVPKGTSFASGRRTRNITSGRLSSGRVRPLDEVRAEIEDDARYENMVVQDAFNGRLGTEKKGEFRVTIPLEDHAEAVQSLDRLVTLRNDLLRSLLDGKRMPANSSISEIDKYAPVAEDEMDLLLNIDDAIDRIHDELSRREELFSELNDEIDDMKDSISGLEDAFRTTSRMGARNIPGPVNFESAMERNIDMADGDDEYAISLIKSDADSIIEALEEIDDTEERFSRVTHEEQIAEIKELIDSADRGDLTPQEFASKLGDLYVKNLNGLEDELSDLFNIQTRFEDNGVKPDREDITGTPEDVFSSSNLSNFDMVEGDTAGFSSGRRKRTQGSKRRPMSDADRQAFADGVRQRAATIPGKKRPGPSKDEFDTGKLSSGRLYFPSEIERNKIGNNLEDNVKIKFGRMSENNDRTPDGKWMLDASKLKMLLKDEDGRQLSNEESAKLLGVSMREFEKMLQDGAGISESDAYTFIDQAFTGGTNPAGVADIMEAIWGFDAVPYWYDSRRGNLLTRAEYEDYKEEGIQMDGELVPRDFDVVEKTVASEVSKTAFPVSALADSLGVESDKDLADAVTFEVDGEKITPTYAQLAKWKKEGVPTAIIEQLVDRGIIPSAGDVFGEEGVKFDNSIRQFDLWKNVRDAIEKSGRKAKYKDLDEVIGAAKVLTRLRAFEEGREGKFSKNTGKALRYTDEEVNEIVDRLNKKYNLNETIESIKGSGSMSSGRRAARRISNSGQEAVEKLSSGRENNGAPENITPRMQKEIMGWAENATWSNFAKSVVAQFKANGFLSRAQWTRLLQLHDDSQRRR